MPMNYRPIRRALRAGWAVVVVLLVVCPSRARGKEASWSVRTWQIPDGSNNTITGVAQSPDGYLWISTSAGLNQFDGARFVHHGLAKPLGLEGSNVRVMLPS